MIDDKANEGRVTSHTVQSADDIIENNDLTKIITNAVTHQVSKM